MAAIKVLVVEDEVLIRLDIADHLADVGYEVLEAGNADQAIRLLETYPDIAVVFTDIDMPGSMDGLKLAAAVCNRWPPIKLIIASGHRNPRRDEMPEGSVFYAKPYSQGAIADTIKRMVG